MKESPRSFDIIDRKGLVDVIRVVLNTHTYDGTNVVRDSYESIKNKIYDITVYELKRQRKYKKGLNHNMMLAILKDLSSDYEFENKEASKEDAEAWSNEYDAIMLKKASGESFDRHRLRVLTRKLSAL
jgi:hypothetical protein